MRVFVTGASGYVGGAVTERLAAAGHDVVGLARSDAAAERVRAAGAQPLRGGLADTEVLLEGVRRAEGVVHAAFDGNWQAAGSPFDHERATVRAMLGAMEGTGRPFVFTSGIGMIGDTGEAVVDEDVVPRPPEESALRIEAERDVLAAARRGVRTVVLRPGLTYGRGGSIIPTVLIGLARRFGSPRTVATAPTPGRPSTSTTWPTSTRWRWRRRRAGTLLHGASGPPVAMRDMAAAIGRVLDDGERVTAWPVRRRGRSLASSRLHVRQRAGDGRACAQPWGGARTGLALEELERGSYVDSIVGES